MEFACRPLVSFLFLLSPSLAAAVAAVLLLLVVVSTSLFVCVWKPVVPVRSL